MQILCCYENGSLDVDTLRSFGEYCPSVEMVNITGDWTSRESMIDSQTRLWHEMRARWNGKDDLVVLKDNLPAPPDLISVLHDCSSLLCVYGGATRYSAELQRKITHETIITGDYCAWSIISYRLNTLWWLHKIEMCWHI